MGLCTCMFVDVCVLEVCVCVCVCVCMYVVVHMYLCACVKHVRVAGCICECACVRVCVRTCSCLSLGKESAPVWATSMAFPTDTWSTLQNVSPPHHHMTCRVDWALKTDYLHSLNPVEPCKTELNLSLIHI